ncbi:MAG TPA: T9SS type A sorting domain-containing protein, partial [Ferruginibacter sp.]|nr:T9SS type A sorting domain-containing protein [Ferruginibacter sp.]
VGDASWNGVVGAVVWCDGSIGRTGTINSGIALTGSSTDHHVGGAVALSNGNYVVCSPYWDNGATPDVGSVTWCNGATGRTGTVSTANSIVGAQAGDQVGMNGIVALSNGNYVIIAPLCDNGAVVDAGAVIWGNGTTVTTGTVSTANALMGSTTNDFTDGAVIISLTNGNYVLLARNWDNAGITDAGAVAWCNGTTGKTGLINSSNALVGSSVNDNVGYGVVPLSNGNYVVRNVFWDNAGIINAGAVTWGDGTTGITGTVNNGNSLVGNNNFDSVGFRNVVALTNGNYVVSTPNWDNGAVTNVGAVTWANGATGITGTISSGNSLVGTNMGDSIGSYGIIALSNGNYVSGTAAWDNGAVANAGAVTWGNGTTGITGAVNIGNSLVGTSAEDKIGSGSFMFSLAISNSGLRALANGNYVVSSPFWDNGAATNAGALTWCNGATGLSGAVNNTNSFTGTLPDDRISSGSDIGNIPGTTALNNGHYIVRSPNYDNGAATNSVAVTFGNGSTGLTGTVSTCNSVLGTASNGNSFINVAYNYTYNYMIVGRTADNIVSIFDPTALLIANSLDENTVSIYGTNPVPLIANTACRIIGTLAATGASPVSGPVTAKVWIESSVPTHGGDPFVARHYEITPAANASTATGRVTLYFTQQEFTDFNDHANSVLDLPTGPADATGISNLRVGKYGGESNNGSGLPGTYPGTVELIDPADADIVWKNSLSRWEVSFNVTGFSGFVVQTKTTALPLTLLEFNGRLSNNNALLTWKTTNEMNVQSFDIERSTDGRNYSAIGNAVALNTTGINNYNYTDNNIASLGAPLIYYRLKQKDISGRFSYSGIIVLTPDNTKSFVLFYPNPVISEANITITINKKEQVQARVIDNAGRILKQQQWNLSAGSTSFSFDLETLAKGIYYLELKGESINEQKQFVKQ